MCGIVGYLNVTPRQDSESILERMTEVIGHRGPDGFGYYRDKFAHLGHRRLSIIDVAAGKQPMSNEDDSKWIVYNGEIFNHASLRPGLEQAGHVYRTRCDTETILHAYEEYGPGCIQHFRGMFAFAIWDRQRRTLLCVRDRLGIKPLYYYWDGRLFAFASEIKGLLEHPGISAELEPSLLGEYLAFGYVSREQTLFKGIRKLMPGHYLQLTLDPSGAAAARFETEQYWDVPAPPEAAEERTDQSWIEECRARLEETVRMRLMSDVPLGMFLSGGVDSSAIAALIKRMASGPVKTFAVGYLESSWSELSWARQVADHLGTDHHEVTVGMEEFFGVLPKLIWHEDEPLAWPSSVALHFVSKLAARDVKVVLTGEGSDELFGGYSRYARTLWNLQWNRRYRLVPGSLQALIRKGIANSALLSGDVRRKLQHTVVGRRNTLESLYLDNFYTAFSADEQRHLSSEQHDPGAIYDRFFEYWNRRQGSSDLSRMLYADQKTYLIELLMKQDQMSMSASIESRVPFLDHPFVEFSTRVPDRLKLRDGCGKYIIKRAVEDLLPKEIIYRPKMGFPTPIRDWLRSPQAASLIDLLREPSGLVASCTERKQLDALIGRHQNNLEDATDRLWSLINLQLWGRIFLEGKTETTVMLQSAG